MSKSYWIWYPGDFELYHGMKQNFSRVAALRLFHVFI